MKSLLVLLTTLTLGFALDESQQLKDIYPLQRDADTRELLCNMQENIKAYLHQTPLSSYDYFHKKRQSLESQSMITWIHGDVFLDKLTANKTSTSHPLLKGEQDVHLGDYRYDLFTLLSDLLLQMQEDADFSGSKEKAILNTLIDGYFDKLKNPQMRCACIDEALSHVKQSDILIPYTHIERSKRLFHLEAMNLRHPNKTESASVRAKVNAHFKNTTPMPIKDIAVDAFGNYLVLCEGNSKSLHDDTIYTLSAKTLPLSYRFDNLLKRTYIQECQKHQDETIARFNRNDKVGEITLDGKQFLLSQLNPSLALKPQSDKTRAYKNYAAALGYMLASFHANPAVETCESFSQNANRQVNRRLVQVELVEMVYRYNETLERRWENFSSKSLVSCN